MPRLPDDTYYTPDALAAACCRRLAETLHVAPRFVLEPSAGGGAFARGVRLAWGGALTLAAIDVRAECAEACRTAPAAFRQASFLDLTREQIARFDLVIGNPPYSLAEDFVAHALSHLLPGAHVAFLLRLSFLGSHGRLTKLFREHPLRGLFPVAGRPSFTPDGRTDASEYGLFWWTRDWVDNGTIYEPVVWKRPAAEEAA